MKSVLSYFYQYNTIELIKEKLKDIDIIKIISTTTGINEEIIKDKLLPVETSVEMQNLQTKFMSAKIIEDLVQLYLRNEIYTYFIN